MPFDPTKPVQTRDGRKARIICTDANRQQPIVALVTELGLEYFKEYTKDGCYFICGDKSPSDLINIPERRIMWTNVYAHTVDSGYSTQVQANRCAGSHRLGILKLTYENDELVDHEYEKLK